MARSIYRRGRRRRPKRLDPHRLDVRIARARRILREVPLLAANPAQLRNARGHAEAAQRRGACAAISELQRARAYAVAACWFTRVGDLASVAHCLVLGGQLAGDALESGAFGSFDEIEAAEIMAVVRVKLDPISMLAALAPNEENEMRR